METTAAQKIKGVGDVLLASSQGDLRNRGISPAIWERLIGDELLGRIAVTGAVARAVVAQMRNIEDQILREVICDSVIETDVKTMRKPVRAWLQAIQQEMLAKTPGSVLKARAETETGPTPQPLVTRPKVEFKLETYEGAEEGCAVWFHGLERQLRKLNVNEEDFLAHAINATGEKLV
jgi:hypothetical protein